MKINASTAQEAAEVLVDLKRWSPFRFSGKWFVTAINGQGLAYRSEKSLLNAMKKAGAQSVEMAVIE